MVTKNPPTEEEYINEFAKLFCGKDCYYDKKLQSIVNNKGFKINPYSLDDVYRRVIIWCKEGYFTMNLALRFYGSSTNFAAEIHVNHPVKLEYGEDDLGLRDAGIISNVSRNASIALIKTMVDYSLHK